MEVAEFIFDISLMLNPKFGFTREEGDKVCMQYNMNTET